MTKTTRDGEADLNHPPLTLRCRLFTLDDGEQVVRAEDAPEQYTTVWLDVIRQDRAYFREHPEERSYTRTHVPSEFWPDFPDASAEVSVCRLWSRPGIEHLRERRVGLLAQIDNDSGLPEETER